MSIPVIAIFDIGKTNKKLLLFDEDYNIVFEQSVSFGETIDEEGDPCEDIGTLTKWINEYLYITTTSTKFDVRAINISAYGASLVNLDEHDYIITPLYNYLKPYPKNLKAEFYNTYNGEKSFSLQTASPVLGNLNSGMQLYRLKRQRPETFRKIKYALHLPQYLSSIITKQKYSEITSIGCHTGLWDFAKMNYHEWVTQEQVNTKLAPIVPSDSVYHVKINRNEITIGVGLHDSSAALIPYLNTFKDPFLLLSTGTWCISLNPFNDTPLTLDELKNDCLCYLDFKGKPIKASRLFAGYEHEKQTKLLAEHFNVQMDRYTRVSYDSSITSRLIEKNENFKESKEADADLSFIQRDFSTFKTYDEAYHQIILDIVSKQVISTRLVINSKQAIKRIFVDGGFSKNSIFMNVLANAFPDIEIHAASVAQATALGAALAIHKHWNKKSMPSNLIQLKHYAVAQKLEI